MKKAERIYTFSENFNELKTNPNLNFDKSSINYSSTLPSNCNPFLQKETAEIPIEDSKDIEGKQNNSLLENIDQTISKPPAYIKSKLPIVDSPNLMLHKRTSNNSFLSKNPSPFNKNQCQINVQHQDAEQNSQSFGKEDKIPPLFSGENKNIIIK